MSTPHRKFRAIIALALFCVLAQASASPAVTPNDPLFANQWNFQAIGMPSAWDVNYGGSNRVEVAVLDSGLNWQIADFQGIKIDWAWAYDYWNDDADVSGPISHGTHVTGTVAQATNNAVGVAGIAFNSTILPFRLADQEEFDDVAELRVAQGLHAALERTRAAGADVVNISLALNDHPYVRQAVWDAYQAGILVVASAGNSSQGPDNWLNAGLPAAYPGVLPVAAVDQGLNLASFSQLPVGESGLGLSAPGVSITQMLATGPASWDGTSMAAPHVAGVAALVLDEALKLGVAPAKGPGRVDWLRQILCETAQDLGAPGPDSYYGYGLLRADLALAKVRSLAN